MATITGRNVVVDPRVKGTITLITERPVTPAAAWGQFLATLRLQGFTVVESAGLYKVVPEADAKLQSDAVSTSTPTAASGQIVTQIFRLNYETANNLVPVLRPLISPNNTINVNPGNNSLVITDYADNLQRIGKIIAAMDTPAAGDVEVITLQHAVASDIAVLLEERIAVGDPAHVPAGRYAQAALTWLGQWAALAPRMVDLSGLSVKDAENPDGDIEIRVTGLRPGEKLYEELLIGDNPLPTTHPRIMKAHEDFLPWEVLQLKLNMLNEALDMNHVPKIRALLKDAVPGYQPDGEVVDWVWMENEKLA